MVERTGGRDRAVRVWVGLLLGALVATAVLAGSCGVGEEGQGLFDNSGRPVTPVEGLHFTGSVPEFDIDEYRLEVDGLVSSPLSLSYDAILGYPSVTDVVLLVCPGYFTDNAEWTGVPVATLLAEADVKPEASTVTFHAVGSAYRVELPLAVASGDGVFLAHSVNGRVLPEEHGYPLRLVAEGRYGYDWVKWVDRIEVS